MAQLRTQASYLASLFSLAGRTAVVTGASTGIGRSISTALGKSGARVILVARRLGPLSDTTEHLKSLGIDAVALPADVASETALSGAIESIQTLLVDQGGFPDILVNAAGINVRPTMDAVTKDVWDQTMAANLTAPFLLGQAFGPKMAGSGKGGRIINIVSQQAFRAYGNSGAYGVSKGGLVSLTRSQAEAWSPKGVLCNAIAPGVVETDMTKAVLGDPAKAEKHSARTMIGRNGLPQDFEGAAVWLASRASEAVTGQVIYIDGGYSAT